MAYFILDKLIPISLINLDLQAQMNLWLVIAHYEWETVMDVSHP